MPTSSEFVTLCQTQVSIVASLGASLSVVYLTEDWVDETHHKLIPVATYPETSEDRSSDLAIVSLPQNHFSTALIALDDSNFSNAVTVDLCMESPPDSSHWVNNPDLEQQKIVIPLVYQDVVMGFLVTGREDRPWNEQEQHQLQGIAHSLAAACTLDRRFQWLSSRYKQQQQVQTQQYQTLQSLLHQLKSPLTALKTFGKLLRRRFLPGDKNQKIAESIIRESDRIKELLQQVDQTLEVADTQYHLPSESDIADVCDEDLPELSGCLNLTSSVVPALLPAAELTESVRFETVLQPLLISANAVAEERQLRCLINLPPNLPPVQANRQALREILSNILDNALKYTPTGGIIEVQVQMNSTQLGIGISDTGPGIPESDLEHLFERGYRGVQADGEISGTGLGLAIAKHLIEQMQGKIEVFSPQSPDWTSQMSLGKTTLYPGTTFVVWLPLSK
ncbi:MAG: GAF domain-containing sensor histidine kinase [Microcoleaceae cyanobacterium]